MPDSELISPALSNKLHSAFYQQDTLYVAEKILGRLFIKKVNNQIISAKIVEVEAYVGNSDEAAHSFRGKTERNKIMFNSGGFLYVYFIYGVHYCANLVTGNEGEGNAVFLGEDPKSIRKKVMRAVTDSGPTEMNQEKPEPIQNLFNLMKVVSASDTVDHFDETYNNCTIRYGDLKKQLAEDIINFTAPFYEKINQLSKDDAYIKKVIDMGAEKARANAQKTIREVREIIGFRKIY